MEIIYSDPDKHIEITIDKSYDQNFLSLAENTLWGTESIVYKMRDLGSEFDKFQNPMYVSLKENNELVAICILNGKKICQSDFIFDAYYLCILAVIPTKMNKGYGTLIVDKVTGYVFSKFNKVMVYAYVEEDNLHSKKVFQKLYSQITDFIAPSYVSIVPKFNTKVSKLNKEDEIKVLNFLSEQYKNHSFVDIKESFNPDTYYVFKDGDEIKAGLQIKTLRWSFISLAGFEGFLMMKIVPKLPVLKRVLNSKNLSFLKIGNIYIADNKSFKKLLDSVLVLNKLNVSVAFTNPNSKIDWRIIGEMKKGLLSSTDSKAVMYYKAKNINKSEIENPQFFSIADSI